MAYKYPNLAAEMTRSDLDFGQVYAEIGEQFGKSTDTISNWVTGRAGEMPTKDAFAIKDRYFPNMTVDYLFNEKPIVY